MLNEYDIGRRASNSLPHRQQWSNKLLARISSWKEALTEPRTFALFLPLQPHLVSLVTEEALRDVPNPFDLDLSRVADLAQFADTKYKTLRGTASSKVTSADSSPVPFEGHHTIRTRKGIIKVFTADGVDIARLAFLIRDPDQLDRMGGIAGLDQVVSGVWEQNPNMHRAFTRLRIGERVQDIFEKDGKPKPPYEILPDNYKHGDVIDFVNGRYIAHATVLPLGVGVPMPRLILLGQKEESDLSHIFMQAYQTGHRIQVLTKPSHVDIVLATLREREEAGRNPMFRAILLNERRDVLSIDGTELPFVTRIIPERSLSDDRVDIVIQMYSGSVDDEVQRRYKQTRDGFPFFRDYSGFFGIDITQSGRSLEKRGQTIIRELMKAPPVALSFSKK